MGCFYCDGNGVTECLSCYGESGGDSICAECSNQGKTPCHKCDGTGKLVSDYEMTTEELLRSFYMNPSYARGR